MEEGAAGDSGAHNEENFPDLTAFSPHDVIFGKGNGVSCLRKFHKSHRANNIRYAHCLVRIHC